MPTRPRFFAVVAAQRNASTPASTRAARQGHIERQQLGQQGSTHIGAQQTASAGANANHPRRRKEVARSPVAVLLLEQCVTLIRKKRM